MFEIIIESVYKKNNRKTKIKISKKINFSKY